MGGLAQIHAIVTGGGTGIGLAIAEALANEGAVVTIAGRRKAVLEEAASRSNRLHPLVADVTDEGSVEALFEAAEEARGPAGIVIANAGAAESGPFAKTSLEDWNRTIAVNMTGAFLTFRAALTRMRGCGWGRLIAVASTAGLKGYSYVAPYCAAKHGVVGLVKSLAGETAGSGVTVNALCPGFTETPLLENSVRVIKAATGRSEADARASLIKGTPLGRFIQPSEIASAALWLCGPGSDAVTGQAISISGGEI